MNSGGRHGTTGSRFGLADAHGYVYGQDVKRRDLERELRALGWKLERHGRRHDVWSDGDRREAVPRHTEINEKLAAAILERAGKKV
jgi:mRNA interferase HicA